MQPSCSMPKVLLLCVVAILRSVANWDTSHIPLFCLPWTRGRKRRKCGLEVLKRAYLTVLFLFFARRGGDDRVQSCCSQSGTECALRQSSNC